MAVGSNQLLKNAVLFDIETLGLTRGLPIHEAALYSFDTQEVHEWILKPAMVEVDSATAQDFTRLASSVHDVHRKVDFASWPEAVKRVAELRVGKELKTKAEVREALGWASSFIEKAVWGGGAPKHPHLRGAPPSPAQVAARRAILQSKGISLTSSYGVSTEDFVQDAFSRFMSPSKEGRTVWIANAAFESKQIGAVLGALPKEAQDQFKSRLETKSQYADPFYVTGVEVNRARAKAQLSGDWTGVWKAYKKYTPKAGEVAIRDVQDITRAMMSYGKKLGFMKQGDSYFGASVDLTYRLMGSLQEDPTLARQMLLSKEAHRAVEDVAISEKFILEKLINYTDALEAAEEGGALGQELLSAAKKKKGALYEASIYFKRLEAVAPELMKNNLLKRLERAAVDIDRDGRTFMTNGFAGVQQMDQTDPHGNARQIARVRHNRVAHTTMDQVVDYLGRTGKYGDFGVEINEEWARMRATISESVKAGKSKERAIIEASSQQQVDLESMFKNRADELLGLENQIGLRRVGSRYTSNYLGPKIKGLKKPGVYGKSFAAASVGLAALGGIWDLMGGPNSTAPGRRDQSVATMNYQEYVDDQSQRSGLQKQGMSAQARPSRTDFGSPWQGPGTSAGVLIHQDLLQEREKYLREQYRATHLDPEWGIFGWRGPLGRVLDNSSMAPNDARALRNGEFGGIRNRSGMRVLDVDPGKWEVEVEDVDTIMLKRKGMRSAVGRFFGLNNDMTFRLEGIDSTEIWHGAGDGAWHVPQPGATKATEAMRALVAGKKISVAFDPTKMTYGRNVGVFYSDEGKNLNLEAVRRGLAAHLPYGKYKEAHTDWDEFAAAQETALASNRGMWSSPWAQTYAAFSEASGNQITFNTFARKEKLAQNASTMSLISLMEHAEASGSASAFHIDQARRIGKSWDFKGDRVRPYIAGGNTKPHYSGYMNQMMQDQRRFMNTYGGSRSYKHSHNTGTGRLNAYLSLDSMGSNNSAWSRRQLNAYEIYSTKHRLNGERKARMAASQREVNQSFGRSPIGHHRM